MKIEIELPPSLQELVPDGRELTEREKKALVLLSKAYSINPTGVNHLVDGMDRRSLLPEDRALLDQLANAARELDRQAGGDEWVEAVEALKDRLGA